jgi:hypothetical protein
MFIHANAHANARASDASPHSSPDTFVSADTSLSPDAVLTACCNLPLLPPVPAPAHSNQAVVRLASPPAFVRRHSIRLAAKDKGMFVDMTDKAMQKKALENTLQACSSGLQKHVQRRGLL